ncbi:serine hydrolase [Sphingomonas sp. NFR15]|uniref:serine hydrolase n=1 Tax=Sphingomonas sp. NFR15 TaxID=1566282 RepID=UPI0015A01BFE|nr:serine hydrolase [Sphingomonas sp. NFR15]
MLSAVAAASMPAVAFGQTAPAPVLPIVRGDYRLATYGATIDKLVADFIEKHKLPGLTMAIVQAPYIPRSAGYGKTSLDLDELASTKTMWNVGPVTQAFTAVAVMQLKEMGKLELSDPVSKHVSGLPAAWSRVTILQLMQHSSGIADYRTHLEDSKRYKPQELLDLVRAEPLRFKSGSQVALSATDATLLALVIEQASGMPYRDFVRRNQIERMHLESTMFADDFGARARIDRPASHPGDNQHSRFKSEEPFINPVEPATGYRMVAGQMTRIAPEASSNLFGFGDLWSSAEDISKWDIGLAGSTLVKELADRDVIYMPTKLAGGTMVPAMLGWEFTHHPGFMEVKGDSPGFSSYLSRFTASDELVCVTLLTNKEGVDLTVLARQIAQAYRADLGPGVDQAQMVVQESKYGAADTVSRIRGALTEAKVPVFATVDHAANARGADLQLRPTTVITFGNPKVGTKLMNESQAIGLDLPLRMLVWEDARGRTWVGYPNLDTLADRYGIKDPATIGAMSMFMDGVARRAANVYAY